MKRFLLWLFPYYLGPERKCAKCGTIRSKSVMVNAGAYGWFCSEEERDEYWVSAQW